MKYHFIFICICLTLLTACEKKQNTKEKSLHVKAKPILHVKKEVLEKELQNTYTTEFLEDYIKDVIINGSRANLGFAAGDMEGGYAYESDAKDIARYVVTLSGKKSSDDKKASQAALFYTSNCGGCHGDDGKGLNGAFADLSLPTLKGIVKKQESLKIQIQKAKD